MSQWGDTIQLNGMSFTPELRTSRPFEPADHRSIVDAIVLTYKESAVTASQAESALQELTRLYVGKPYAALLERFATDRQSKPLIAVFFPDGRILADSTFKDAEQAITVALGWPDKEEILNFYKSGGTVTTITVKRPVPTLYEFNDAIIASISKRYGITIEELTAAIPEVR